MFKGKRIFCKDTVIMLKFEDTQDSQHTQDTQENQYTAQSDRPDPITNQTMMKSPFSCSIPFDDAPVFDPDVCRRRHYCMFNMRISSCIEKTTSMPSKNSHNVQAQTRRRLMHNDSVGTLMVEKKKPFIVRFKS